MEEKNNNVGQKEVQMKEEEGREREGHWHEVQY